MKKLFLLLLPFAFIISCNNKKSTDSSGPVEEKSANADGKTASFTVDGKTYTGLVSTQYMGDHSTGAYSVICQQDDPQMLLQAVFKDEKDPGTHDVLLPRESYFSLNPGDVHLSLSGQAVGPNEFVSSGYNDGTIKVKDRTLIIDHFKLYSKVAGERTVTATIPF